MRLLLAVLVATSGCTQLVDVSDYAFDEDPCGPAPPECEPTGERLVYVAAAGGMVRADAMGRRDGFDLDGTSDRICGQPDFVSPTGEEGIDNQGSFLVEAVERSAMIDTWEMNRADYADGRDALVLVIDRYDGPDDPCVEVRQLVADVRAPELPDADGDGELDPGLPFANVRPGFRSTSACVIDGVVHGRFDGSASFLGDSVDAIRGRLRARLDPTRIRGALVGAAVSVEDIAMLFPEAASAIRTLADTDPSARGARDCRALSSALSFDFVPAEIELAE